MVSIDVRRELERARWGALVMLLASAFGLLAFDNTIVFVVLCLNAVVWLARFWVYTGHLHEISLAERGDR